jgi:hypothetical protein
MEAYRIDRFGSVDGIELRSSDDPRPGLREVLMRVRASSLNYRDLMVLKGDGRGPTKLGVIPLSDGAGEVAAIGDGVTRLRVGDRIAAVSIRAGLAAADHQPPIPIYDCPLSSPDSPLKGTGFEPSVPLLRKALLGVASRRRRHERQEPLTGSGPRRRCWSGCRSEECRGFRKRARLGRRRPIQLPGGPWKDLTASRD